MVIFKISNCDRNFILIGFFLSSFIQPLVFFHRFYFKDASYNLFFFKESSMPYKQLLNFKCLLPIFFISKIKMICTSFIHTILFFQCLLRSLSFRFSTSTLTCAFVLYLSHGWYLEKCSYES